MKLPHTLASTVTFDAFLPPHEAPNLGTMLSASHHGTMLLTAETTENGEHRVYFTRQASVVSYFACRADGGTEVHVHPDECACPWSTTTQKLEAVRLEMLRETARRLNCAPEEVYGADFLDIVAVADQLSPVRAAWAGRPRARLRVRRA